jgi:mannose-1-phosphate guanylyltransferase
MGLEFQIGQLWGIVLAAGEGTRVRAFLSELCGGRGIKQFCAVIGRRSMLQYTLDRVERLISRKRILIVVSRHHCEEVVQQLTAWPAENIIFQPENCDTTAGILLPLAHVTQRDPLATVAIFPSDHFILDEGRFMEAVRRGVWETQRFPWNMTLLGMLPDGPEDGYGWIMPSEEEQNRETRAVRGFWEKPTPAQAQELWQQGAVWNTFVCIAQSGTLWNMARRAVPEIYGRFRQIRQALGAPYREEVIEQVYTTMPAVNFCSGLCEPLANELRVLPLSAVGWSDWGTTDRIWATVKQLGKQAEFRARLNQQSRNFAPTRLRA